MENEVQNETQNEIETTSPEQQEQEAAEQPQNEPGKREQEVGPYFELNPMEIVKVFRNMEDKFRVQRGDINRLAQNQNFLDMKLNEFQKDMNEMQLAKQEYLNSVEKSIDALETQAEAQAVEQNKQKQSEQEAKEDEQKGEKPNYNEMVKELLGSDLIARERQLREQVEKDAFNSSNKQSNKDSGGDTKSNLLIYILFGISILNLALSFKIIKGW